MTRSTVRTVVIGFVLAIGGSAWAPAPAQAAEPVTRTFDYTGAVQEFTVPAGVNEVDVVACGAQGGATFASPPLIVSGPGGLGGQASRTLAVTPARPSRSSWAAQGATAAGTAAAARLRLSVPPGAAPPTSARAATR